jgi:hypothetical protein
MADHYHAAIAMDNCKGAVYTRDRLAIKHDGQLNIRAPRGELRRWRAHARKVGLSLTDYVRQQCNMGLPPRAVVAAVVSGDQVELPLPNTRPELPLENGRR